MENLKQQTNDEPNTINFNIGKPEKDPIIKLCANGDIFVKGKLIENDLELVEGLRDFLKQAKTEI